MRLGCVTVLSILLPVSGLSCSTQASSSTTSDPQPDNKGGAADGSNTRESTLCQELYDGEKGKVPQMDSAKGQRILELVNVERKNVGVDPLLYSSTLENAAQIHAFDMATRNFFSHSSPENCDMTSRVLGYAGYVGLTYGENIAAGHDTPEKTVAQWMASPGHKANILNKAYNEVGVGYVSNPSATYRFYWVQNFGAK
jgi:uncharacterized protein YkwD